MLGIWLRWSWRDLRARWLQVAAIALIIAIGTGSYAGLTSMNVWREASNDASYELTNIFDVRARLSTGSGLPVTPVYFAPVGGTGVIGSLRPDLTGVANNAPDGAYANRDAFAAPAPGTWGNAPRNSITGPRTFGLDMSVARTFRVNNRLSLDWRIDATNVLNRVSYAGINALITSPQFGLPNRANEMRKIRTNVRLRF